MGRYGTAIPAWVSQFCCGLADAHRLTVKQIHQVEGGWRVDGYSRMIPDAVVFPSEDENVWLFYRTLDDGAQMAPICFFVPQGSTWSEDRPTDLRRSHVGRGERRRAQQPVPVGN